jgi:hypothetical protein
MHREVWTQWELAHYRRLARWLSPWWNRWLVWLSHSSH